MVCAVSELNYAGWRYPAGEGGYFSQEHTPASSVMPSPAVDAANPMDVCKQVLKSPCILIS